MVDLQHTAGNRAVARLALARAARGLSARRPISQRTLARCGSGGCSCDGTCRDGDDGELLREGRIALRRAIADRAPEAGERVARPVERAQRWPVLQRSLRVRNPGANIPNPGGTGVVQTNAATIQAYLQQLCASGSVTVDGGTGAVALASGFCAMQPLPAGFVGPPSPSPAQTSATPVGCGCLCDMIASGHIWTIVVDDIDWPHTAFDDHRAAVTPGTGTGGDVTAPSPNSTKLWGAGTVSGRTLDIAPWLVLGHELCGHAWMGDQGRHGPDEARPRGRGGHQETVRRENLIRAEHNIERRGSFKDPNCGESYWRDRANPGTVNWSSYRNTCIQWRAAYNRAHGTRYRITDRIP